MKRQRTRAEDAAEDRVLEILVPGSPADSTARQTMRKRLREGLLDDKEIELELVEPKQSLEIMGPAGMEEMAEQLKGMFAQFGGAKRKLRKVRIAEALQLLVEEEAARLVNDEEIKTTALANAEQNGIVFIDEIDKVASRAETQGADVSRQGVQRDLLPLVEGTTVNTKYGHGEDRPHPLHRLGRLPPRQAERPDPGAAGALPDPRRARFAERRRLRGDPDADSREPGQAVPAAARHRRRDARTGTGRDPAPRADRLRRQRAHREHRCAAPVDGDGASARRGQLRRRPTWRGARCASTPMR